MCWWFFSIIISAVERYVKNIVADVRDLSNHINENGKRLLDLDEHSREQSKTVNAWHGKTETAIDVIGEDVLAYDSVAKKRHKNKTDADLGPSGWDRYVGETLCLSIDADHLEMPMPGHVHLLHGAMEEAFTYLSRPDNEARGRSDRSHRTWR